MSNVTALKREQVIDEDWLQLLEGVIADARDGKVTEMCFVARMVDDGVIINRVAFDDPHRLVGALELAKFRVMEGVSIPA